MLESLPETGVGCEISDSSAFCCIVVPCNAEFPVCTDEAWLFDPASITFDVTEGRLEAANGIHSERIINKANSTDLVFI